MNVVRECFHCSHALNEKPHHKSGIRIVVFTLQRTLIFIVTHNLITNCMIVYRNTVCLILILDFRDMITNTPPSNHYVVLTKFGVPDEICCRYSCPIVSTATVPLDNILFLFLLLAQTLDCWYLIEFSVCELLNTQKQEKRSPPVRCRSTPNYLFPLRWLQDLELRWQEYYELVTLLLQWISHHIRIFSERKFPTSYEEIEVRRGSYFGKRDLSLLSAGLLLRKT